MPRRVLIIANSTDKYAHLVESLSSNQTSVSVCSYHDLAFYLDGDNSFIKCFSTDTDLREFDKILILATSPYHRENYIFSALSCFCQQHHIAMLDDSFSNTDGKLYALWRFWQMDLPTARTAFGPDEFLVQQLGNFGTSAILKSVQGTKGKDNYLIQSAAELRQVLDANQDTNFVLQNYIENDGDWRIVVVNFEPKLAIYRSSHHRDFRNNTSVGGEATLVPLEKVDPKVLSLSVAAARALDIKIAGADILPSQTGEYTILEVNRTPQLATGAFTEAKSKVLRQLIS